MEVHLRISPVALVDFSSLSPEVDKAVTESIARWLALRVLPWALIGAVAFAWVVSARLPGAEPGISQTLADVIAAAGAATIALLIPKAAAHEQIRMLRKAKTPAAVPERILAKRRIVGEGISRGIPLLQSAQCCGHPGAAIVAGDHLFRIKSPVDPSTGAVAYSSGKSYGDQFHYLEAYSVPPHVPPWTH